MLIDEIINFRDNPDVIRQLIADIIIDIHGKGAIDQEKLEQLAYFKLLYPDIFAEQENTLLYVFGLFYKTRAPKTVLEFCYNIYANSIKDSMNETFTPVQADIFARTDEYKYFSFSAPTSIGKSYIFRHLIYTAPNDVVVVVPSRALIAEYLMEITKIVNKDVLVLQFIDNVNIEKTRRHIFVVTPERARELFKWKNTFQIDLFLFDEAQISDEGVRGMTFDALVRRVDKSFPNAKKVFAHPFVTNPEAQFVKNNIRENIGKKVYQQQSVGKIYLTEKDGVLCYFSPFQQTRKVFAPKDLILKRLEQDSTLLVYTSKSDIYNGRYIQKFKEYIDRCPVLTNDEALQIIHQFSEYVGGNGKNSIMLQMMKRGIVIHHGSIPLFGRMLIERFVRAGFAKICFATSTLIQGINMPFDIVWIDCFRFNGSESDKIIAIKNLIGRAGRTTHKKDFDYGFVVVPERNKGIFTRRLKGKALLSEDSVLNQNVDEVAPDVKDVVEAIQTDSFNDDYLLPEKQLQRIKNADIKDEVRYILDNLMNGTKTITHRQYTSLTPSIRNHIKRAFEKIYVAHLPRDVLTSGEKSVLSTSISILLWIIQGRTFSAILANRYAYITNMDLQRQIKKKYNNGEITEQQKNEQINAIKLNFSQQATDLPNIRLKKSVPLFPCGSTLQNFKYDTLIFDTYDYIDKIIYFCLSAPLSAAFKQYYDETHDERAEAMINYIKYGTNSQCEIWLTRYGFSFEHIDWIKDYVAYIDEQKIIFNERISELDQTKLQVISRFL